MLYKFLPPERRSFFHDRLLRFTQPGAFNDPFELHPSLDLISRAEQATPPLALSQSDSENPETRIPSTELLQQMYETLRPGIERAAAQFAGEEGYFSLNNNLIAQGVLDSKFGILSLTASPSSLLMWAHYASNHRGFVLQFDETHPFFAAHEYEGVSLTLRDVDYSNDRPVLSFSTLASPTLYYRKGPEWAHEQEWRLVRPLSAADQVSDHQVHPIALFRVPPEAVTGVILGVGMSYEDRKELTAVITSSDLKHITIFQTRLSDERYALQVYPHIDGGFELPDWGPRICEPR